MCVATSFCECLFLEKCVFGIYEARKLNIHAIQSSLPHHFWIKICRHCLTRTRIVIWKQLQFMRMMRLMMMRMACNFQTAIGRDLCSINSQPNSYGWHHIFARCSLFWHFSLVKFIDRQTCSMLTVSLMGNRKRLSFSREKTTPPNHLTATHSLLLFIHEATNEMSNDEKENRLKSARCHGLRSCLRSGTQCQHCPHIPN